MFTQVDGWTYGFEWVFRGAAPGHDGCWCDSTNHEAVSPYNTRAFWSDGFANPKSQCGSLRPSPSDCCVPGACKKRTELPNHGDLNHQ